MDALSFASLFLIKRLNLHSSTEEVKHEFVYSLELNQNLNPIQTLVLRFNRQKHLVPALGSWIYCNDAEKMHPTDVIDLFGAANIQTLASRIFTAPAHLAMALADLIPAMINKAAINGELKSRPPQNN